MEEANKDLIRYIENSQITHVTAFYGVLNINTLEFHYCRAGHPQILLQRDQKEIIELNTNGSFLGMFDNIEFEEAKINLKRGDRLYFYTDGIPEAKGLMETYLAILVSKILLLNISMSQLERLFINYLMRWTYLHNIKRRLMIDPLLYLN